MCHWERKSRESRNEANDAKEKVKKFKKEIEDLGKTKKDLEKTEKDLEKTKKDLEKKIGDYNTLQKTTTEVKSAKQKLTENEHTFFKNELSMKGLSDFGGGNHNPAVKDLKDLERDAWKTWLESDELGKTFTEVPQDPDGNCMFRCLSVALFGDPNKHSVVRLMTVAFLNEYWARLYGTLPRTEMNWTSKAWGEVCHQRAASIMWNFTVYTMGFWPEKDRESGYIRDKAISPDGAPMDASNTLVLKYHWDDHYHILQMPGQEFPLACFVDRDVASINIWRTEMFNFGSDNAGKNDDVEVQMNIDERPHNEHGNDNNAAENGASNSGSTSGSAI